MSYNSTITIVNIPKEYKLDIKSDEIIKQFYKNDLEICDTDGSIIALKKVASYIDLGVLEILDNIKKEGEFYIETDNHIAIELLKYHSFLALCEIKEWIIKNVYVPNGRCDIIVDIKP